LKNDSTRDSKTELGAFQGLLTKEQSAFDPAGGSSPHSSLLDTESLSLEYLSDVLT
jgi:hypothetical protein